MNTAKFRTRQERGALTYPKGKDFVIGLDVGYSATKLFFETGYACFPSFVKEVSGEMLIPDSADILYRDDTTGKLYLVGYNAQNIVVGTNNTDGELFSRNRYANPHFRVICYTAIGMAVMKKQDKRKIVIQTGLPAAYMSDKEALKRALSSIPKFSIKLGSNDWVPIDVNVTQDSVFVMPQPMGALYSVLIKNDGTFTDNAMEMLSNQVMVLDAGFGTFDFYGIQGRQVVCQESLDDISMRAVFAETTKLISEQYNEDIRVPELQQFLTTGTITCFDEDAMSSEEKPLAPLLDAANKAVFAKAKEKIRQNTGSFRGYKYLIVDGGTGDAWYEDIKEWLGKMKTLAIVPSNKNDHLAMIYSNARGYYMFRYTSSCR